VSVFDKTSETIRDDTFYTTDTEAYLVFELIDEDFTPDSAMVTVYNIYGKATINANVEVADGIVCYEMPEDAIGHPGGWRTQVVFTKDSEDYTTKIIEFDVGGHLLDNKKPSIVDIENWNSFMKHAEGLVDDWEQLEEIRQTNEQQRELAESARQTEFEANETSRQANELVREEAESNRQSTFETNETERQTEFETNEAERESTFEINESTRQTNELARETAESVRVANEEERISKDSERDGKIEAFVEDVSDRIDNKADVSELELYAKKEQGEWITPTLLGGATGNTVAYLKDEFGFVHFKGRVSNAGNVLTMFVMPSGYRPGRTSDFIVFSSSDAKRIRVNSSGNVDNSTSQAFVELSSIIYKAEG